RRITNERGKNIPFAQGHPNGHAQGLLAAPKKDPAVDLAHAIETGEFVIQDPGQQHETIRLQELLTPAGNLGDRTVVEHRVNHRANSNGLWAPLATGFVLWYKRVMSYCRILAAGRASVLVCSAAAGLLAAAAFNLAGQTNLVDASTLTGKFLLGYQAWHACAGDGKTLDGYIHWSHLNRVEPTPNDVVCDLWPDLSEFPTNE